jgi:hypothetical protein
MQIVSLVPSITEAVCMLGLEDALVGITDYCLHPAQIVASKVHVGGTKNPRIRDIQALSPDLVIVNTDENRIQISETDIRATEVTRAACAGHFNRFPRPGSGDMVAAWGTRPVQRPQHVNIANGSLPARRAAG